METNIKQLERAQTALNRYVGGVHLLRSFNRNSQELWNIYKETHHGQSYEDLRPLFVEEHINRINIADSAWQALREIMKEVFGVELPAAQPHEEDAVVIDPKTLE